MTIESNLESERVQELDQLLDLIKPLVLDYIEKADPNSGKYQTDSLGKYYDPQTIKKALAIDETDLSQGIKGDNTKLVDFIDKVLNYSVNTWNPGFLDKLYASNNPIGIISDIILSVLNTNVHVYTVSPVLAVLENFIAKKYAGLFFKDNKDTCGGLTFSGGSWSNITSLQAARALKFPQTKEFGNEGFKFAIYASEHCHYSIVKGGILIGLGSANVFKVPVIPDGTMNVEKLELIIEKSIADGYTPLYINATAGTTVYGSYDDFTSIASIAKKYNAWFHIDGSWGGNVIFSQIHSVKLAGCHLADSITVNPHKMLGIPNTCSFMLMPHVADFQKSMSLQAPYLFHGRENNEENFDLADGTMGCGRRSDALKFYMGWLYYGQEGFESRINHAFEIAKYFIDEISKNPHFELVLGSKDNLPQCLQVCFYYKPEFYTKEDHSEITRFVSRYLHKEGKYLVDFSPNPSDASGVNRGEFFRVVFNSPILTDSVVDDLIHSIVEGGEEYYRMSRQ
ncbi:uncharacterized protein KQ657_002579 [Scheffersomyces spartinae]|uniref:Glutamate decarboxylase n=1 Tax=Scheffersomyces spartinae TaxID=45513 RepID=A0A9P7V6D7_9ASCO|nr:uncharacterized protein KQ657_002579 [Scheffersomyces spartinae]KAG7191972.1 hypothetical protein KQ657_002579 [Scheffersomyces spartinae]